MESAGQVWIQGLYIYYDSHLSCGLCAGWLGEVVPSLERVDNSSLHLRILAAVRSFCEWAWPEILVMGLKWLFINRVAVEELEAATISPIPSSALPNPCIGQHILKIMQFEGQLQLGMGIQNASRPQPPDLQVPHPVIRVGEDHLLSHRVRQPDCPGEDWWQEDVVARDCVHQVL